MKATSDIKATADRHISSDGQRMKPPGQTTLYRMQLAAQLEAERIEIGEDGRVREGMLKEPRRELVEKRDDFAGIVRLIDAIMSDQLLLDRLQERMRAGARAVDRVATGDEEVEAE